MSHHEKSSIISLITMLLILAFYLLNLLPMVQNGELIPSDVFRLWGTVIVLGIVVNIVGNVITYIATYIIENAGKEDADMMEEPTVADERDKLIDLRGVRNSYVVFSLGVFVAMLSLVLENPPLVMFNLLIVSGLVAQIAGDISRLYFYRRGF